VWFYEDYARELEGAGYLVAYRDAVWDRTKRKVFPFPGPSEWHPDAWLGRKAIEYLNRQDDRTQVFLWIAFSGPTIPLIRPSSIWIGWIGRSWGWGTFERANSMT
jgi:hypothetical protein